MREQFPAIADVMALSISCIARRDRHCSRGSGLSPEA